MKYCNIGGQAVIEGVMMKSKNSMATAVRNTEGTIEVKAVALKPSKLVETLSKIPFIRGTVTLITSMIQGVKILLDSAEMAGDESMKEDYKPSKFETWVSEKLHMKIMDAVAVVSVTLALLLFVGLFILLPAFLAGFLPKEMNTYLRSLCEGVIRIVIFLGYIVAVTAMKDIRRTYMYHGAEHKVIACYEHQAELTPDNAKIYSRLHPRCGTAFLLIVMVIAVLVYGVFPFQLWWQKLIVRLIMLPVIAGISYEVLKLLAKSENWFVRALRAPGLALQRLTTKEPTPDMLEVSITAFKKVLVMDGLLCEEKPEEMNTDTEELEKELSVMNSELEELSREKIDFSGLDQLSGLLDTMTASNEEQPQ